MRKTAIQCSVEWAKTLKTKTLKGKLYLYTNNVPQRNPTMFKI